MQDHCNTGKWLEPFWKRLSQYGIRCDASALLVSCGYVQDTRIQNGTVAAEIPQPALPPASDGA